MGLNPEAGGSIHMPEGAAKATIAAGCFWGVEHMFRKTFEGKGLYDARVGYIGGDAKSPSYRSVCLGRSGRTSPFPLCPFLDVSRKEKKTVKARANLNLGCRCRSAASDV
jgi:hypothetical protein